MFIMKYRNRLIEPPVKKVDCSNKIITIYKLGYDENHLIKVFEKEKVNIYDKIQSYSNDVYFTRILKTIQLTENPTLYVMNQSSNIDLTSMPTSFTEAHKIINEAKSKEEAVKSSEYFKSKGLSFDEFVKCYSSLDHLNFLKEKYEKKEADK